VSAVEANEQPMKGAEKDHKTSCSADPAQAMTYMSGVGEVVHHVRAQGAVVVQNPVYSLEIQNISLDFRQGF
jgi:hypothetical protein